MSEQDRIHQMVEDGKISREEADLLLEALGDVDEAEADVDARASAAEEGQESRTQQPEAAATPGPTPPTPPPPYAPHQEPNNSAASATLPWVRIDMLAGDLQIDVDPSLTEPRVDGRAQVSKSGRDFTIKQERQKGFLEGLMARSEDLDVTIPAGYGLDLRLMAGDVAVRGVPFLKGSMLSGDVQATDIGGIDLDMKAGDLDISLRLTEGKHRIHALAGDIDLRILRGSDLAIEGNVLAGDLHAPFDTERRMVGGRFRGKVGEGRGQLDVRMKAGDLHVEVQGE